MLGRMRKGRGAGGGAKGGSVRPRGTHRAAAAAGTYITGRVPFSASSLSPRTLRLRVESKRFSGGARRDCSYSLLVFSCMTGGGEGLACFCGFPEALLRPRRAREGDTARACRMQTWREAPDVAAGARLLTERFSSRHSQFQRGRRTAACLSSTSGDSRGGFHVDTLGDTPC